MRYLFIKEGNGDPKTGNFCVVIEHGLRGHSRGPSGIVEVPALPATFNVFLGTLRGIVGGDRV